MLNSFCLVGLLMSCPVKFGDSWQDIGHDQDMSSKAQKFLNIRWKWPWVMLLNKHVGLLYEGLLCKWKMKAFWMMAILWEATHASAPSDWFSNFQTGHVVYLIWGHFSCYVQDTKKRRSLCHIFISAFNSSWCNSASALLSSLLTNQSELLFCHFTS